MVSVGVIGSGSWGTTLAFLLAKKGFATTLWDHHPERAIEMQRVRENAAFVPGIRFPELLQVTSNIAEAAVALFYAELGPGTEREGSDELARAQVSETATLAFSTVPDVLSRVLVAQFERANRGWRYDALQTRQAMAREHGVQLVGRPREAHQDRARLFDPLARRGASVV